MTPVTERFWDKVEKTDGCWFWRAYLDAAGYGRFTPHRGESPKPAHRFAYELCVGAIPSGLTLDHLCRVRSCVNPAHLEPVTSGENTLRGMAPSALNARKTHCKRGHELAGENVWINPATDARQCRSCTNRRREAKRRAAGVPPLGEATTCRRGHEWTPESTYWPPRGGRVCRICLAATPSRRSRAALTAGLEAS